VHPRGEEEEEENPCKNIQQTLTPPGEASAKTPVPSPCISKTFFILNYE
jgi:hypothetical protein